MIELIELTNFGQHEKLTIEFDPAVTTLVGDSDAGKTTVIQALHWIATAKPTGIEIINYDADLCKVRIRVDGHWITKTKGRTKPTVHKLDKKVYHAAGTLVPDDILALLNLHAVNFQLQLDPPLWLLDSAGQVSKHLNSIVNLESIDKALALASSKVKHAKSEVVTSTSRSKALKESIESVSWAEEFNLDLLAIEQVQEDIAFAQESYTGVLRLLDDVQDNYESQTTLEGIITQLNTIALVAEEVTEVNAQYQSLGKLVSRIRSLEEEAAVELPDLGPMAVEISKYDTLRTELDVVAREMEDLDDLADSITKIQSKIRVANKAITASQSKLNKSKGCPLCLQPIVSQNHKH